MIIQEDLAQKQKLRDDKKKLDEAKARASQKGPMGTDGRDCCVYLLTVALYWRT